MHKLVQQARQEATNGVTNRNEGSTTTGLGLGASSGSGALTGGSGGGMTGAFSRLTEGLSKGLFETAQESRSSPSALNNSPNQSVTPPSSPGRPSMMNNMTETANGWLSNVVSPPKPRSITVPAASAGTTSSRGMTIPQGPDSRSTFGLLALLAVLGLAWYFTPQLIVAFKQTPQRETVLSDVIHPADIRSRFDVVRAFHQFALRRASLTAEWWTHRAVEQHVVQESPSLQPVIHTLTDLYEQARYLPEDAQFGPDQIESARRALAQCEENPLQAESRR
jgi:hypothetical protein